MLRTVFAPFTLAEPVAPGDQSEKAEKFSRKDAEAAKVFLWCLLFFFASSRLCVRFYYLRIQDGIHSELMKNISPAIALLGEPAVAHGVAMLGVQ